MKTYTVSQLIGAFVVGAVLGAAVVAGILTLSGNWEIVKTAPRSAGAGSK